jgi:hypothetical protein
LKKILILSLSALGAKFGLSSLMDDRHSTYLTKLQKNKKNKKKTLKSIGTYLYLPLICEIFTTPSRDWDDLQKKQNA